MRLAIYFASVFLYTALIATQLTNLSYNIIRNDLVVLVPRQGYNVISNAPNTKHCSPGAQCTELSAYVCVCVCSS